MERVAICYDVSPKTVESPQYLFGSAPGFFSFCWDDVSVKAESYLPTDMLVYEKAQEVVQVDLKEHNDHPWERPSNTAALGWRPPQAVNS